MSFAYFTDVDGQMMMVSRDSVTAVRYGGKSSRGGPEELTLIDTADGSIHTVRHTMDEVYVRLQQKVRWVTCPHCQSTHQINTGGGTPK